MHMKYSWRSFSAGDGNGKRLMFNDMYNKMSSVKKYDIISSKNRIEKCQWKSDMSKAHKKQQPKKKYVKKHMKKAEGSPGSALKKSQAICLFFRAIRTANLRKKVI